MSSNGPNSSTGSNEYEDQQLEWALRESQAPGSANEQSEEEQLAWAMRESQTPGDDLQATIEASRKAYDEQADNEEAIQLALLASEEEVERSVLEQTKRAVFESAKAVLEKSETPAVEGDEDAELRQAIDLSLKGNVNDEDQPLLTKKERNKALEKAKEKAEQHLNLLCVHLGLDKEIFADVTSDYITLAKGCATTTAAFENANVIEVTKKFTELKKEQQTIVKENFEQKLIAANNAPIHLLNALNAFIRSSAQGFSDFLKKPELDPQKLEELEEAAVMRAIEQSLLEDVKQEEPSTEPVAGPSTPAKEPEVAAEESTLHQDIRCALARNGVKESGQQQAFIKVLAHLPEDKQLLTLKRYLNVAKDISPEGLDSYINTPVQSKLAQPPVTPGYDVSRDKGKQKVKVEDVVPEEGSLTRKRKSTPRKGNK